jgi:hypothetical protein
LGNFGLFISLLRKILSPKRIEFIVCEHILKYNIKLIQISMNTRALPLTGVGSILIMFSLFAIFLGYLPEPHFGIMLTGVVCGVIGLILYNLGSKQEKTKGAS